MIGGGGVLMFLLLLLLLRSTNISISLSVPSCSSENESSYSTVVSEQMSPSFSISIPSLQVQLYPWVAFDLMFRDLGFELTTVWSPSRLGATYPLPGKDSGAEVVVACVLTPPPH